MKHAIWLLAGGLFLLACFFKFAMLGYDYIGYALAFAAALLLMNKYLPHGVMRVVAILVCLGLVYFCIVEIPIVKNSRGDKDAERDYLIVLGAAVHGDVPSLALKNRVGGAVEYLQKYPRAVAIVSGGQGEDENMSEAECMKKLLIQQGISPERILTEDRSTSTMENLTYSFDIIRARGGEPDGHTAILSSSYHLYRAKSMAGLLGVTAVGVPGKPDWPLTTLNFYIREAFGVTHLWVFGR